MKRLVLLLAVLVTFGVVSGCSASNDIGAADEKPTNTTAPSHPAPHWVTAGISLARSSRSSGDTPLDTTPVDDAGGTTTTSTPALPPRDQVVALLTTAGLSDAQATCVYNGISANPQVAQDIGVLFRALKASQGPSGGISAPAALTALQQVSPDTGTRLVVAIAPCLDSATLFALLSTSGGGSGSIGLDSVSALAKTAGASTAAIPKGTANQIGALLSASLTAAQKTQLQQLLSGATVLNSGNIPGLDLEHLDLSKLTPDQTSLLIAALIHGLTGAQQQQLQDIAKVDLNKLKLNVDTSKLKPEELGQLLLLLSPLLAAGLSPLGFGPPPGFDPTQIYLPPGTDLSQLNPLLFLNRDDIVNAAKNQGGNPVLAGCLYDRLRALSPLTLAKFFSSSGDQLATAEVLLSAISCVTGSG